jgi:AcrR family transcriptional regulator
MTKAAFPSPVKPLKRPSQARAKFTVQAIYDAFVRIWQRDGWERLTTRTVALETGISVGTLYDYFPNKLALLSGYVRHSVELLLEAVEREAVQPPGLSWQQRVQQVVRLMCGVDAPELAWFHPRMLALEAEMALPKHHRRVREELVAAWQRVFDACTDLPVRPAPEQVQAMHLALWGGRRYALLLELDESQARGWAAQMERMCCLMLQDGRPWLPQQPDARPPGCG